MTQKLVVLVIVRGNLHDEVGEMKWRNGRWKFILTCILMHFGMTNIQYTINSKAMESIKEHRISVKKCKDP